MMLLFIVFAPLIAAALILAGAPARKTALWSSGLTLAAAFAMWRSSRSCKSSDADIGVCGANMARSRACSRRSSAACVS